VLEKLKNSINVDFVALRKKVSWEKVYQEFIKTTNSLIKAYRNQKTIPKKLIDIEIRHYQKTHAPQIEKVLKGF